MDNNKKRENSSKNTTNWGTMLVLVILMTYIAFIANQLIINNKDINWTYVIIVSVVGICSVGMVYFTVKSKGKTKTETSWEIRGWLKHTTIVTKGEEEKPKNTIKPIAKNGQAPQEDTPTQPEVEKPKRGRGRPRKGE